MFTVDDIVREVRKTFSGKTQNNYTKKDLIEDEYRVFLKGQL